MPAGAASEVAACGFDVAREDVSGRCMAFGVARAAGRTLVRGPDPRVAGGSTVGAGDTLPCGAASVVMPAAEEAPTTESAPFAPAAHPVNAVAMRNDAI